MAWRTAHSLTPTCTEPYTGEGCTTVGAKSALRTTRLGAPRAGSPLFGRSVRGSFLLPVSAGAGTPRSHGTTPRLHQGVAT